MKALKPGTDDFVAYAVGLYWASACTSLTDAEATSRLNLAHPTGISSQWKIADDPTFADGTEHPCPCPDSEEHRHLLFHC